MDPISISAVLIAIAGGVGSGLGTSLWTGIGNLVRRPFRHRQESAAGATAAGSVPSGEQELAALGEAPADEGRALALAHVLVNRAADDPEFMKALQDWWDQAAPVRGTVVKNTISGGTVYGPVFQGQNFTGITFGNPAAPPPPTQPPGQAL